MYEVEVAYPTFTAMVGLATRRITPILGLVPIARVGYERIRATEWELRSG